jgi:hypothetical protein
MYLFFIWSLYLRILMGANSLLGPLDGVGPENLEVLGPKWHSLCSLSFEGPKKSRFSASTLPMALKMDFPASKLLCPALYKNRYINSQCVYSQQGRRRGFLCRKVVCAYGDASIAAAVRYGNTVTKGYRFSRHAAGMSPIILSEHTIFMI